MSDSTSPKKGRAAPRAGSVVNSTFVNGLSVLEGLSFCHGPRGVTELAARVGLTKSNVHRLLRTLVDRGYVRNLDDSGRYELTLKLWELGVDVLDNLDVKAVAMEHMKALAKSSGETVHLSILDRHEVVYVDKVDSPNAVRAYSKVGGRAPAYCVATGKALLAFSSPEIIAGVAATLHRYTPTTIVSERALRVELGQIRDVGYAINRGEWRQGVCGIGAPIRDAYAGVIAAIGVSGPIERLKPRRMKSLAPIVLEAARAISSQLGYSAE